MEIRQSTLARLWNTTTMKVRCGTRVLNCPEGNPDAGAHTGGSVACGLKKGSRSFAFLGVLYVPGLPLSHFFVSACLINRGPVFRTYDS